MNLDAFLPHLARCARHTLAPTLLTSCLFAAPFASANADSNSIDREAVVRRHDVHNTRVDPEGAITLGNGDFALTVDVTGLQGLERVYYDNGLPLETRTTWAWHTFPNTEGHRFEDTLGPVNFHGREILYPIKQRSPAGAYFRENPHPMPMGQFSFTYNGEPLRTEDIAGVDQKLDLWTGAVTSRLLVQGQPLEVVTVADGEGAVFAVEARSPLIASGVLGVRVRFPYSYRTSVAHKSPFIWEKPGTHTSKLSKPARDHARIAREADETRYTVDLRWDTPAAVREAGPHDFRLASTRGDTLRFSAAFSDEKHPAPTADFAAVRRSSADAWHAYWTKGGMIDLGAATDPRAPELERRIILSLYLVRVNYAGSFPPAETGLQHLSWFGKHNSEVYFLHAAQFYQWGHAELIEKGLGWYRDLLPQGIAHARSEGFDGVRWPKMSGLDGRPSPGGINPYIIWNQPNPIYLAELVYRAAPTRETLERYRELVFESAKFLVSFAKRDDATGIWHLGPPIKNVTESTGADIVRNPAFETAFWYFGLALAQTWRERLGLPRDPLWEEVKENLAELPRTADGKLYLEIEGIDHIYGVGPESGIPTSMLLALGYLPATPKLDLEVARRTFDTIHAHNGVARWVSWQMGQGAMTATRLGEPQIAIDILTNRKGPARFMHSGYVRRPKDPEGAVAYLPVNSAFLGAVGLMAGGWDGAPAGPAPGFPKDGTWDVKVEGVLPMP
ncbi:hypothetical protein ASA1KI_35170 [Opitutales bacterium ASA1]|uniref:hypothetical protein n=1 Tax=Congregicoccus parvus TaxID=3081749 RepID=UPI002B295E72|nr:hypothetical protein ASA1KI_35170 [Opitutales bacterium ASA1]